MIRTIRGNAHASISVAWNRRFALAIVVRSSAAEACSTSSAASSNRSMSSAVISGIAIETASASRISRIR